MQSCSTEDLVLEQQSNIETVSKTEAVSFVKGLHYLQSSTAKSSTFQNDFDFDKITQEKITNTSELLTVIPIKTKIKNQRRRALFLRVGTNIESMIYHEFAEASSTQNSFDGIVLMTRLNGDFIRAYRLKNNKYVIELVPNNKTKSSQKATQLTSRTIDGGELNEVVISNNFKNPTTYVSLNEMGAEVPITISWDALGSGGTSGDELVVELDEDFTILNKLTDEAKCIYEKLKNSSNDFENSIKKFDGDFPVSHLMLTINDNLEANVYGKTYPLVNYITEVQISNTALQSLSDLGKATVFAHEIIHAEIYRKMLSAAQGGTLNSENVTEQIDLVNSLKDNFPGLYDYYEKRFKSTWNHEMMANHYRTTIADIIQKFDNYRLPRSAYEAVSWVGLGVLDRDKGLTTIAWDNLTRDEKAAINSLINNNFYNGPSNCM